MLYKRVAKGKTSYKTADGRFGLLDFQVHYGRDALALFERTVLSPAKVAPAVRQMYPEAQNIFKDAYMHVNRVLGWTDTNYMKMIVRGPRSRRSVRRRARTWGGTYDIIPPSE